MDYINNKILEICSMNFVGLGFFFLDKQRIFFKKKTNVILF